MSVTEQVKSDLTTAMKAGEKERVGTLRMLLSELQKDAKEGSGDELAVLRRERKRRLESARAFTEGERPELAAAEQAEAGMIEAYLPAEIGDEELRALVAQAVAQSGASGPADIGVAMKAAIAAAAGRADGRRVSELVKEALGG